VTRKPTATATATYLSPTYTRIDTDVVWPLQEILSIWYCNKGGGENILLNIAGNKDKGAINHTGGLRERYCIITIMCNNMPLFRVELGFFQTLRHLRKPTPKKQTKTKNTHTHTHNPPSTSLSLKNTSKLGGGRNDNDWYVCMYVKIRRHHNALSAPPRRRPRRRGARQTTYDDLVGDDDDSDNSC